IVCGAKNMKVGDKVPLALVGAVLPNGMEIRAEKIRGEDSAGMLCSGKELGFNDDASGLLILPADFAVGEPFEAIIDLKVTPNRSDCLSVLGVARDIAAMCGKQAPPPQPRLQESVERAESHIRVTLKARNDCPRYTARYLRSVRVGPSPDWLRYFLEASGYRSINNVVDVTNYVLLELGHPLHAFDADKVNNHHIVVRNAEPGETLVTLDGQIQRLEESDVLITDPQKGIALGGIMGCANTEVSESTINVLLEAAYFNPVTIRRTSKRLDKQTESSYRFERGTDREKLTVALNRAAQLIQKVAGGEICKGIVEASIPAPHPAMVPVRSNRVAQYLGVKLTTGEIAAMLVNLGFEIRSPGTDKLVVVAPSHRVDIQREADLIEEIARLHGYNKIPSTIPPIREGAEPPDAVEKLARRVREQLNGFGLYEAINYSFIGREQIEMLGLNADEAIALSNPLTKEMAVLRTSLVPSLLANLSRNHRHGNPDAGLYEIGKTYHRDAEGETGAREVMRLGVGITGRLAGGWGIESREADFFTVKALAESFLEMGRINNCKLERLAAPYLHPGRAAAYVVNGDELCRFGELLPDLQEKFELRHRAYLLEMNLDLFLAKRGEGLIAGEVPRFPASERDMALVMDADVPAGRVESLIHEAGKPLLESLTLFDLYTGKGVADGKKSLAYRLVFRSADHTLQDAEVVEAQTRILETLTKEIGAVLRT
ncbi:MAG: phenylalanine--tRNA ligase subunit beta, partial [bacterium]